MNRDQNRENISRHELARLTREMCELSQHSLQGQFVHVVEPRKLNVTGEKVDFFFLFTVYLAPFFALLS